MNCKYCANKLAEDAKFCNKCGKSVVAVGPGAVDIEKIKKSLINTGNSVYAVGWITIVLNVGVYLWSVLDKNFAEARLPAGDLSGTFLMVAAASIFIILGNRIRRLVDIKIKLYLQVLLGLSLFLLAWVILSGGSVGILFILVVAYLVSSLTTIRKAMKVQEFTSKLTSPKYIFDKKGWIIFIVAVAIIFIVTIRIDLLRLETGGYSKGELITETVKEVKTSLELPSRVDETTTLVDVTAEPSAIRYHYVISGLDVSDLKNEDFEDILAPSICQDSDTKYLLDLGINMEYSYLVQETSQKYFVSVTKTDCSE